MVLSFLCRGSRPQCLPQAMGSITICAENFKPLTDCEGDWAMSLFFTIFHVREWSRRLNNAFFFAVFHIREWSRRLSNAFFSPFSISGSDQGGWAMLFFFAVFHIREWSRRLSNGLRRPCQHSICPPPHCQQYGCQDCKFSPNTSLRKVSLKGLSLRDLKWSSQHEEKKCLESCKVLHALTDHLRITP